MFDFAFVLAVTTDCVSLRPRASEPLRGNLSGSELGACSFGLSPKFSTPVEKTVENPGDLSLSGDFIPASLGISAARIRKLL